MQQVTLRGISVSVFIIALLTAVLPNLNGEYFWDDLKQVKENPAILSADGYRTILISDLWGGAGGQSTQLYHPVPMLTFWLQAKMTRESIVAFRVGNLLIHLVCVLLLYLLLKRLGFRETSAVFGAAIFGVHPSITEPTMWLTGRHDTLGALFSFGAVLVWPRENGQRIFMRAAASSLMAGLAFLCKEPYITVLVLVPLFDLTMNRPGIDARKRGLCFLLLPLGAGADFLVRWRIGVSSRSDQLFEPVATHVSNFGAIFIHYLFQAVTFRNGRTTADFETGSVLSGICVIVVLITTLVVLWRQMQKGAAGARQGLFGLSWFAVTLAPHVVSLPMIGMYGNRYLYFPMAGLVIAVAAAGEAMLPKLSRRTVRLGGVFGVTLIVFLGAATYLEARNWRDALTLYGADLMQTPDDPKTLYHFGHAVRVRYGCQRALPYFEKSAEKDPGYWRPLHNQAGCLINLGEYEAALTPAKRAYTLRPEDPRSLYNFGVAQYYTGHRSRGIALIKRALALDPGYRAAERALALFQGTSR